MNTKYLFELVYRREGKKKTAQFQEYIVAETWEQAQEHWRIEFLDQGVQILEMKRIVPVLAILPKR